MRTNRCCVGCPGFEGGGRIYWRSFRNRSYLQIKPSGTDELAERQPVVLSRRSRPASCAGSDLNAQARPRTAPDTNRDGIAEDADGQPVTLPVGEPQSILLRNHARSEFLHLDDLSLARVDETLDQDRYVHARGDHREGAVAAADFERWHRQPCCTTHRRRPSCSCCSRPTPPRPCLDSIRNVVRAAERGDENRPRQHQSTHELLAELCRYAFMDTSSVRILEFAPRQAAGLRIFRTCNPDRDLLVTAREEQEVGVAAYRAAVTGLPADRSGRRC